MITALCILILVGSFAWLLFMMTFRTKDFIDLMRADREHKQWMMDNAAKGLLWWLKRRR